MKTDNLKFRTDLRDRPQIELLSYGWLASNKVDECKQRQIAKTIFKLKIQARPGFHCISFAKDLAANFGCNPFRITPGIVSKLLLATI